jgi:S1-C subfamily serine protease
VAAPETRPRDPVKLSGRSPLAGAVAVNLSPAVAEELSIDLAVDGVALSDINDNSTAAQIGFRKGDIIVAVNGEAIRSSRELEKVLAGGRRLWELTINRGGQTFTTVLGG